MERIYKELRADFYVINKHGSCGYLYDRTEFYHGYTVKEIYKELVSHAKKYRDTDLLAIYVSDLLPIFSIHNGEHIFVENYNTRRCAMLK